ncbi:hypothetical protein HZS_4594 [Henneguya salminicola]|nr:hypothetical protein HZS_4594 [Henneguya salminicola]
MKTLKSFFTPSKRKISETLSSQSPEAKKEDKENILDSKTITKSELGEEKEMDKLKYDILGTEGMGLSWKKALNGEFIKKYFVEIKVVVLGQDPYHGPNQAHGIIACSCGYFYSTKVRHRILRSLENIYKELSVDILDFSHPRHGYLIGWARQGVLLLNSCLSVEAGKANSHQGKGWELLTDAVISWINLNLKNVVFLLWGAFAQKKCSCIDTKIHLVLKSVHPSPLSAHRGFLGCKHFSKTNDMKSMLVLFERNYTLS